MITQAAYNFASAIINLSKKAVTLVATQVAVGLSVVSIVNVISLIKNVTYYPRDWNMIRDGAIAAVKILPFEMIMVHAFANLESFLRRKFEKKSRPSHEVIILQIKDNLGTNPSILWMFSSLTKMCLISPFVEEYLFRGLFNSLLYNFGLNDNEETSQYLRLALVNCVFAILHRKGARLCAFSSGLIYSRLTTVHQNTLWASFFTHALSNTIPVALVTAPLVSRSVRQLSSSVVLHMKPCCPSFFKSAKEKTDAMDPQLAKVVVIQH